MTQKQNNNGVALSMTEMLWWELEKIVSKNMFANLNKLRQSIAS